MRKTRIFVGVMGFLATVIVFSGIARSQFSTREPSSALSEVWISPPSISAGSRQSVLISARLGSAVLANERTLQVREWLPSGEWSLVGSLNDDGLFGDPAAGDGIYSTVITPSDTSSPRLATFLVSGAFARVGRVQASPLNLAISEPIDTSDWASLSDSNELFSLRVPKSARLAAAETKYNSDTVRKKLEFITTQGNTLFVLTVYTISGWAEQQANAGALPVWLAQTPENVFAYSVGQSGFSTSEEENLRLSIPAILSTFEAAQ